MDKTQAGACAFVLFSAEIRSVGGDLMNDVRGRALGAFVLRSQHFGME